MKTAASEEIDQNRARPAGPAIAKATGQRKFAALRRRRCPGGGAADGCTSSEVMAGEIVAAARRIGQHIQMRMSNCTSLLRRADLTGFVQFVTELGISYISFRQVGIGFVIYSTFAIMRHNPRVIVLDSEQCLYRDTGGRAV